MSKMANAIFRLAVIVANIRSSEPAIELNESTLKITFVKPKSSEYAWERLYNWGAIFYGNQKNPLKVKNPEGDSISGQRWKQYIDQKVISQSFAAGPMSGQTKLLLYGIIGLQFLSMIVIIGALR